MKNGKLVILIFCEQLGIKFSYNKLDFFFFLSKYRNDNSIFLILHFYVEEHIEEDIEEDIEENIYIEVIFIHIFINISKNVEEYIFFSSTKITMCRSTPCNIYI